ncbi:hypothetical protein C8Q74DRAFT_1042887 [Fomes fomentarius]|nr:hypothetical protein C8Q74DRAFT_1042887 [Fomes fomentarius]
MLRFSPELSYGNSLTERGTGRPLRHTMNVGDDTLVGRNWVAPLLANAVESWPWNFTIFAVHFMSADTTQSSSIPIIASNTNNGEQPSLANTRFIVHNPSIPAATYVIRIHLSLDRVTARALWAGKHWYCTLANAWRRSSSRGMGRAREASDRSALPWARSSHQDAVDGTHRGRTRHGGAGVESGIDTAGGPPTAATMHMARVPWSRGQGKLLRRTGMESLPGSSLLRTL